MLMENFSSKRWFLKRLVLKPATAEAIKDAYIEVEVMAESTVELAK